MSAPDPQRLAQALAGEYSNAEQAIAEPIWYVHLRLWIRPVPLFGAGEPALFLEQANVYTLANAYRQRVVQFVSDLDGTLAAQFWQFREAERWRGAGAEPDRLGAVTAADLVPLPGCRLRVAAHPQGWAAQLPPGCQCRFTVDGRERQVHLGFRVLETAEGVVYESDDYGIDPVSSDRLWGALMGPYRFRQL